MYRNGEYDRDNAYYLRMTLDRWYDKRQTPKGKFIEIYKSIDRSTIKNSSLKEQLKSDISLCEDSTLSKIQVIRIMMTSLKKYLQHKEISSDYYYLQAIFETLADLKGVASEICVYFDMFEFVAHYYGNAIYADLDVEDRIQKVLGFALDNQLLDQKSAQQIANIVLEDMNFWNDVNQKSCTVVYNRMTMSLNKLDYIIRERNLGNR